MPNSHLKAIKSKLQALRGRFYLVVLWHCLLICSLLAWLGYIFQLALGQPVWLTTLWGLAVPLAYSGYRIIKCPSLVEIAALADQRCQLNDKLVTAWQYRDSEQPALPLLLEQVSGDLDKIKPSLLFNFRISPRYAVVAVFLAVCSWYFYHYPLGLAPFQQDVQSIEDSRLNILVTQMEEFRKELNKMAPGAELPQVTKTANRLQQLVRELEHPESRPQVMPRLQELKQELEQSIPAETVSTEIIQGAEGEHKPALIELEIKSERLAKMMQKLNKLGFSTEQIQNRALRELAGLLNNLIQFNIPGQGNRPGKSGAKTAGGTGGKPGSGQAGLKLPLTGLQDTASVGGSGYTGLDEQRYLSRDTSLPQGALSLGDLPPGDKSPKYTYLPSKYQQRVYTVLTDQHIPLYYRRQVRDYFDALQTP